MHVLGRNIGRLSVSPVFLSLFISLSVTLVCLPVGWSTRPEPIAFDTTQDRRWQMRAAACLDRLDAERKRVDRLGSRLRGASRLSRLSRAIARAKRRSTTGTSDRLCDYATSPMLSGVARPILHQWPPYRPIAASIAKTELDGWCMYVAMLLWNFASLRRTRSLFVSRVFVVGTETGVQRKITSTVLIVRLFDSLYVRVSTITTI